MTRKWKHDSDASDARTDASHRGLDKGGKLGYSTLVGSKTSSFIDEVGLGVDSTPSNSQATNVLRAYEMECRTKKMALFLGIAILRTYLT
ncbi:hypothetical protein AALO_G00227290, partial [Alosa alosa]